MLTAIAELAVRRRKAVLLACLVLFLVAAPFGGDVQEHLNRGGFQDPHSESARAEQILNHQFGTGPPNVVLLVEAKRGDVDAPDVAAAGVALTEELATEPAVAEAVSYWTLGNPPPLRSGGGNRALVLGRISGGQDDVIDHIEELSPTISFIKLFGIGLTMAVLMDATLIRGALVPAFMRVAGGANWWSPAPLRRIYDRWGIHGLPEQPGADHPEAPDYASVVREPEPSPTRPPLVPRGTADQAGRRL